MKRRKHRKSFRKLCANNRKNLFGQFVAMQTFDANLPCWIGHAPPELVDAAKVAFQNLCPLGVQVIHVENGRGAEIGAPCIWRIYYQKMGADNKPIELPRAEEAAFISNLTQNCAAIQVQVVRTFTIAPFTAVVDYRSVLCECGLTVSDEEGRKWSLKEAELVLSSLKL